MMKVRKIDLRRGVKVHHSCINKPRRRNHRIRIYYYVAIRFVLRQVRELLLQRWENRTPFDKDAIQKSVEDTLGVTVKWENDYLMRVRTKPPANITVTISTVPDKLPMKRELS